MGNKILFVTTHFPPDLHYGGVVESGYNTFTALKKICNIRLVCVSKNPRYVKTNIKDDGEVFKSVLFHKYGFSFGIILFLIREILKIDFVYCHGIVTFPVVIAQIISMIFKKPYAVSTLGLTERSFSKRRLLKSIYFALFVFPLLKRAKFVRITSEIEGNFLKRYGINNIIKIEHGLLLNKFSNLPDKYSIQSKIKTITSDMFIFLYLGRISEEKGIDILIESYNNFCKETEKDNHRLYIVGPDLNNYLKKFNIENNEKIVYIPGLYGADKIAMLRRADVVILPSYTENFGNTVAESLVCETPVITTTETPWRDILEYGCGLYIRPNISELSDAMKKIYDIPDEDRKFMGKKGRELILSRYDIDKKAESLYMEFSHYLVK